MITTNDTNVDRNPRKMAFQSKTNNFVPVPGNFACSNVSNCQNYVSPRVFNVRDAPGALGRAIGPQFEELVSNGTLSEGGAETGGGDAQG